MVRIPRSHPALPQLSRWPRWLVAMLAAVLVLSILPPGSGFAAPPGDLTTGSGWATAETERFHFVVQANEHLSADAFATTYGDAADRALSELQSVFGVEPGEPIAVYVYADPAAFEAAVAATGRIELPGIDAVADAKALDITISLDPFRARTPLEAENALRHAVSHILTGIASDFTVPRGFDEGIAQYVERPVTPHLARIAALVQGASQSGQLLSWSDLNRPQPPVNNPELIAAQSYSVAAFLVSRYRVPAFQTFLKSLATAPSWRDAMRSAYGRSSDDIEKQWRENLVRWTAGEWKDNLIAGFDLDPARDLLTKGNYLSAKQALELSQQLFTEIADTERLAAVEEMLTQCDTGLQAEALMVQVEQALDHNTYDRAASLLTQARTQYELLPPEQRPDELLTRYDKLATTGITAGQQLDEAIQRSHRWGDYPEARAAALSAGGAYARLGDTEMTNRTHTLLAELDDRQRRIVMLLGALGALTFAWLGLWLWARGPAEIDWN